MDVTPLVKEGQKIVQSYSGGVFKISGAVYNNAVIITPGDAVEWPAHENFSNLSINDFESIISMQSDYDVFLLGTGMQMSFMAPELKKQLVAHNLSFDLMDSGAACRTYNVLMAEGRRVLAALLPYS